MNTAGAPTGNPSPAPSTSTARTTRQINGAKFLVAEAKVGGFGDSPSVSRNYVPSHGRVVVVFLLILARKTNGFFRTHGSECLGHLMDIRVL